jgi:hypothetical protein
MDNPKIGDNKQAAFKQYEIKNNRVFLYMDGRLTHIFGTAPGVLENLKKMGYVDRYRSKED